jgi:hypothetical protein
VRHRHEIEDIAANVTAEAVDGQCSIGCTSRGATRRALVVPGASNEQAPCLRLCTFVEPKATANVTRIDKKTPNLADTVGQVGARHGDTCPVSRREAMKSRTSASANLGRRPT